MLREYISVCGCVCMWVCLFEIVNVRDSKKELELVINAELCSDSVILSRISMLIVTGPHQELHQNYPCVCVCERQRVRETYFEMYCVRITKECECHLIPVVWVGVLSVGVCPCRCDIDESCCDSDHLRHFQQSFKVFHRLTTFTCVT